MSLTISPVVLWIAALMLVALYCAIGIALRFVVQLTTGDDPADLRRPRRALLRDMLTWPLLAIFVVTIVLVEGVTVGQLARDYRSQMSAPRPQRRA